MSRVNPDTGRAVKVAEDSLEALTWPTAAEYRSERTKRRQKAKKVEAQVERAVEKAIKSEQGQKAVAVATQRAGKAVTAVRGGAARAAAIGGSSVGAGAASLGAAGTAAAVVGAFGVGYAIGTGLRKAWQYLKPEERNYRKALAFREARLKYEAEKGRPMTLEEVRAMGRGFLDSLSEV